MCWQSWCWCCSTATLKRPDVVWRAFHVKKWENVDYNQELSDQRISQQIWSDIRWQLLIFLCFWMWTMNMWQWPVGGRVLVGQCPIPREEESCESVQLMFSVGCFLLCLRHSFLLFLGESIKLHHLINLISSESPICSFDRTATWRERQAVIL